MRLEITEKQARLLILALYDLAETADYGAGLPAAREAAALAYEIQRELDRAIDRSITIDLN